MEPGVEVGDEPVGAAVNALGEAFECWVWSGRRPTEALLASAEAEVGAPFPPEYRRFVMNHGCAAVIRCADGAGVEFYGLARSCPSPMDVRRRRADFNAGGRGDLVPVAGRLRGGPLLAFDPQGRWYRLDGGEPEGAPGGFVREALRLVDVLAGAGAA